MDYDVNCVFCKISHGIVPSTKLYEDDDVIAFLDINPVTYGHALVIPKKHYESFLSTSKDVMHKAMDLAQRIGQVQIKQLGAKGVNILCNCGESAGQAIPHFHIHVIPRYNATDGFKLEMKEVQSKNLPALAEKLKQSI